MEIKENDITIEDIFSLFIEIKRKKYLIILFSLIMTILTFCLNEFVLPHKYISTAMLYVMSNENNLNSQIEIQNADQLINDYKIIIYSHPIIENVIKEQKLNDNYKILKDKITIENPNNGRILTISVEEKSPQKAKSITDAIATETVNYIENNMNMNPPKIIEYGIAENEIYSPNIIKNTVLSFFISLIGITMYVIIVFLFNNKIKTEEDIENYLKITVLGSIPIKQKAKRR